MKIGFVGLGKLGSECARVMAEKEHDVIGYDIQNIEIPNVKTVKCLSEVVVGREIVFVAVPTPHDPRYDGRSPCMDLTPKDFSYNVVKDVIKELDSYMSSRQLLVLISTVLPGTVRRDIIPLIKNSKFIYNPYLIAMGTVAWDMVNPEMIMMGTEDGVPTGLVRTLKVFYETIVENNPPYVIGTWDECECIKVFYNTFISTKLTLVNMIQDVAQQQGNINVDVVTNALSAATRRILGKQYMTAGMGDGGACHPRDNIALRYMSEKLDLGYDFFAGVMRAREVQAQNLAKELVKQSARTGYPIVIHGKAYKPGVAYEEGSYSILIGHYCEEMGVVPHYVDPMTGDAYTPTSPCVFLLAHNTHVTYGSDDSGPLYCDFLPGSIVIDPWRSYQSGNCQVIHYGNTRNV
jgi:UDPglucose 6-dehydrogenase